MVQRRGFLNLFDERGGAALLTSLFLILLGSRALLISYAGSPTPFVDEWEGDGAYLLAPYLRGELKLSDLFAPYAEHRILFTRLLVLSAFLVAGYWDVILQMIANAILDTTTVVAVAYALSRVLNGGWAIAAMVLSVGINAMPYAYDNVVYAFNSQFYFVLAFSLAALAFLADARAWSPRWAAGVLFGVGAFLSMASGALTLAAAAGAHLLQMACNRRGGVREWLGLAALAAITVALISLVPHASDELRARSVGEFLWAFLALAGWPAHNMLGLIIFLPSALFCLRVLADRPALSDPRWFNVMALGWVVSQILAVAFGRGQSPLSSRYFDILLVGLTINLVSAFWLFERHAKAGKPAMWRSLALALWLVFLALSLTHPQRHLPSLIEAWRTVTTTGEKNVQRYLATADPSFLAGRPLWDVPSPDPPRLKQLLDTPEIRSILPPELLPRVPPRPYVEAFKRGFLRLGFVWLGVGMFILAAVIARALLVAKKLGAQGSMRDDPLAG